jgi:hypothetical protein
MPLEDRAGEATRSESINDGADLSNPGLSAADQLDLKEVLEAPFAALAAIAGLFVSTEWRARRARRTINLDHPGANASRYALCPLRIPCLDVAGKAVGRIIRDPDGIFLGIERDHG